MDSKVSIKKEIQIWYLFHSGFAIKTDSHYLVFDYYNDRPVKEPRGLKTGVINPEELADAKVYVFSSHSHHDHFNPVIFNWKEKIEDIKYILSDDIKIPHPNKDVMFVHRGQTLSLDDINIRTYGSTDMGVSFLIEADGINIFHSGDLNWWHWKNDSSEAQKKEEEDYKNEIDLLKETKIDIAFVPADPRLDEFYYLSTEYFLKTIEPSLLLPMHFGTHYSVTKKLKNIPALKDYGSKIVGITHRGQRIVYSWTGKKKP